MAVLAAVAAALPAVGYLLLAQPAAAASLVQVTNFGTNPSSLQMYVYVPNSVTANPPILVALHQCTGSGPGFYSGTEFASLADQYGFPGDQRITSAWNATVSQSGSSVTAANASYDGTISPGGSVSIGFQGTWISNDTAPTSFSLNGTACG